jgi:hypothetical protein
LVTAEGLALDGWKCARQGSPIEDGLTEFVFVCTLCKVTVRVS